MILLAACVLFAGNGDKPEALVRAEAAHSSKTLRTGEIECSIRTDGDERFGPPRTTFYSWKCADDRVMVTLRGDEDGVIYRLEDGQPAPLELQKPVNYLLTGASLWYHPHEDRGAYVLKAKKRDLFDVYDYRRLGLDPVSFGLDFDVATSESGSTNLQYRSERRHGLEIVTAEFPDNAHVEWWIDPSKDWSVVRARWFVGDLMTRDMVFDVVFLEKDGVWFPKRVEDYSGSADAGELTRVLEIHSVEFNRPEHDRELTEADIGIEVGVSVIRQDSPDAVSGVWDGKQCVSNQEYVERVRSGDLVLAGFVARENARSRARRAREYEVSRALATSQPTTAIRIDSEWEAYTRRFIAHFALDVEQTQKAWQICRDCQERARRYMDREQEKIDELERKLAAKPTPEEHEMIQSDLKQRLAPVQEIFEQQLKPRLDALPTRAQRGLGGAFDVAPRP